MLDVFKSEGVKYLKVKEDIFKFVFFGGCWKDIDLKIFKEYMKSCWDMDGGRIGILWRFSFDEFSLIILIML